MISYQELVSRLGDRNPKQDRDGTLFFCPCHPDGQKHGKRSARVWPRPDGSAGVKCFAGCNAKDIFLALGFDLSNNGNGNRRQEPVATYDYRDADGKLGWQVVRGQNKEFWQQRPDGRGGWLKNLQGVKPLLYRLPETLAAVQKGETVFIPEGEKDCNNLARLGLAATTNSCGAPGKWPDTFSDYLIGADVVILPDNDDPGQSHADKVALSLQGKARSVKVVALPGLPEKGDVSDFLASGGTKEQLLQIVAETLEWEPEQAHPRSTFEENWPDPEPIQTTLRPVDALLPEMIPEPFRGWVLDVSYRMQCPVDFVAIATIIETGSVIGAGCDMRPKEKDDWKVVSNLWGGVIARPSMLKTPALAEAMKPVAALEAAARETYEAGLSWHEAEREAFKAQKDALKNDMLTAAKGKAKKSEKVPDLAEVKNCYANLEEPETPTRRRYKTNDATVEKVAVLLNENPRGMLIFRDELVGLLVNWDREDRQADRAFYLEAWNGQGSFTTDRIGRGTLDTQNLCVSILGGIQPSKLTGYLLQANDDLKNDGLLQRFQMLVYPDEPKNWKYIDQYPSIEAKGRAFEVFNTLAEADFTQYGAKLPESETIPFFHFDSEAQETFRTWLTELEAKIKGESAPLMVEHLSKYRSLMPSLALIFHLINIADGHLAGAVTRLAAEQAAAWCDYLESHARRIYGILADISPRSAEELAERIKNKDLPDGFTIRDVYHKGWHLLEKKEIVEEAVNELVELGWLREDSEEIPGRQPKIIYRINPKIFATNAGGRE